MLQHTVLHTSLSSKLCRIQLAACTRPSRYASVARTWVSVAMAGPGFESRGWVSSNTLRHPDNTSVREGKPCSILTATAAMASMASSSALIWGCPRKTTIQIRTTVRVLRQPGLPRPWVHAQCPVSLTLPGPLLITQGTSLPCACPR